MKKTCKSLISFQFYKLSASVLLLLNLTATLADEPQKTCEPGMKEACVWSGGIAMEENDPRRVLQNKIFSSLQYFKESIDEKDVFNTFKNQVIGHAFILVASYTSDSHLGYFFTQYDPQNGAMGVTVNNAFIYTKTGIEEVCSKFDVDWNKVPSDYFERYLGESQFAKAYNGFCKAIKGIGGYGYELPLLVTWPYTNKKVLIRAGSTSGRNYSFTCSVSVEDIGDKGLCRFL